jgi:hypothetical protein
VHTQLTSSSDNQVPTEQNGTCLQAFEWYVGNNHAVIVMLRLVLLAAMIRADAETGIRKMMGRI